MTTKGYKMETVKIPKRFYEFRYEMFGFQEPYDEIQNCECGMKHEDMHLDILKETSKHYEISIAWDCELFKDFYSQAEYQATVFGDEIGINTGVLSSARATVKALDKTK
tara:strand:+ start:642 stop:968 length:327 start_codon:yes stop_codon:yes gene_type:complete